MTHWIDTSHDLAPLKRGRSLLNIFARIVPGAVTLALSMLFGFWTLYVRPDAPHAVEAPTTKPAARLASNPIASNPYGALFDPRALSGSAPAPLAQSFPLEARLEPILSAPSASTTEPEDVASAATPANLRLAESAPLPVPRPTELGLLESHSPLPASGRRFAQQNRRSVVPTAAPDNRSFFEKLFSFPQPSGRALAYAAPQDGVVDDARKMASVVPSPRFDQATAIYDISAHTVYLPNGTKLEAHSGLGDRLDDPRYVNERMRGATPPSVYELAPREQLFHGVRALRLKPVGGGGVYGRTGLLAHTYMLGPNGDSNGCVSFRNYNAFLQAYEKGEIRRLVVVARLN